MAGDRYAEQPHPATFSDCLLELLYWADQHGADYEQVAELAHQTVSDAEFPMDEHLSLGDEHSMDDYDALGWVSNHE